MKNKNLNSNMLVSKLAFKRMLNAFLDKIINAQIAKSGQNVSISRRKLKQLMKRNLKNNLPYKAYQQSTKNWLINASRYFILSGFLTLGSQSVLADFTDLPQTFNEYPSFTNPLDGFSVGASAAPRMLDYDNDGDLDVFVGNSLGTISYFENTGTSSAPVYVQKTGSENPLDSINIGAFIYPAFADLDGDGDMDLYVGSNGTISAWQNNGNGSFSPAVSNPVAGLNVNYYASPTFGDIDGDGDLDLVVSDTQDFTTYNRIIHYFENTGSNTSATFIERTGASNPFTGLIDNSIPYPTSTLSDLDGDGDLDYFVGNWTDGSILSFENTGTANAPKFTARVDAANPFQNVVVGGSSFIEIADLNADGIMDAVVGNRGGVMKYFRSAPAPVLLQGPFFERTGEANLFDGVDIGWSSIPAFADIDNDGDMDAVMGEYFDYSIYAARIFYLRNDEGSYNLTADAEDPFSGITFPWPNARTAPAIVDIDADGDLDVFTGSSYGYSDIQMLENIGTASAPDFVVAADNPFAGLGGFWWSKPEFVDIDGDGDQDAFIGEYYGSIQFFENIGTAQEALFINATGSDTDPLAGEIYDTAGDLVYNNGLVEIGNGLKPTFTDIDGDGDYDMVIGNISGNLMALLNIGSTTMPKFAVPLQEDDPLFLIGGTSGQASPTFVDIDGDGDKDLVVGNINGQFQVWERNSAPVAIDLAVSTDEDTALRINALSSATDADSPADGFSVGIVSQPNNGEVIVDANTGELVYFPYVDFNGVDSFTYNVSDDQKDNDGKSNPATSKPKTVTITVNAVDDIPAESGGGSSNLFILLTLPLINLARRLTRNKFS